MFHVKHRGYRPAAAEPVLSSTVATTLPDVPVSVLAERLQHLAPEPLSDTAVAALAAHYAELRRWGRRLALVGPGTAEEVVERHYGESLAGAPLVGRGPLVDVGSGAGFPGFVLAAVCSDLEVVLVEPRERKWAFLQAAVRRASLPCQCLNARVSLPLPDRLPERIGCVTTRALKLPVPVLQALAGRLVPGGRFLFWAGAAGPELPPELAVYGETRLAGTEHRRILDVRPRGSR